MAGDDIAAGRLKRLFTVALEDRFGWFIVSRAGEKLSPAAAAFRDWLLSEAKAPNGIGSDRTANT